MDILNRTMTVERLSDGRLSAFVAPTGERTVVTVTPEGSLQTVTDPYDNSATFQYNEENMMIGHKPSFGCQQNFK